MGLETYNKKRRFNETPEPEGVAEKDAPEHIFVVQRHHASHLHYDFRLELSGTLKSWAVPKGPSLNPADKRLAMMVEDHPISYATFEGDIPAGNYGGGHVDVWDHGTYEPVDDKGNVISFSRFYKDLMGGSIKFRMHGKHLKGEFALVNLKKDKKSWLLIKHRDKYATDKEYNSEDYVQKSSLAYTELRQGGASTEEVLEAVDLLKKTTAAQKKAGKAKKTTAASQKKSTTAKHTAAAKKTTASKKAATPRKATAPKKASVPSKKVVKKKKSLKQTS